MNYSKNGELTDAGLDLAINISNGEPMPPGLSAEEKALIDEALRAMDLALLGRLDATDSIPREP